MLRSQKMSATAVVALSHEQRRVVSAVLSGRSVLITGGAGVGKSVTIKHIKSLLPPKSTAITALTGCAASQIGGTTLHSWAGIKLGNGDADMLVRRMKKFARRKILATSTLIVDEVSMWNADLFDKIERVVQIVRSSDAPFGGIQLVLSGDFFQIPPVKKADDVDGSTARMLFESKRFAVCVGLVVELREVFRQREERLITLLNEIRKGVVTAESVELINSLKRPIDASDGILPTRLFCTNVDVDTRNHLELSRLSGEVLEYPAEDSGDATFIAQSCIWPVLLRLKLGAQVMLLVNDPENRKLVNGSRGVVIGFRNDLPVVRFSGGIEKEIEWNTWKHEDRSGALVLAARIQIPLKLAWNITIHKSQGMTIDRLEVHVADAFDYGMAYVALSRATSLDGLRVASFNPKKLETDPKVNAFYEGLGAPDSEKAHSHHSP